MSSVMAEPPSTETRSPDPAWLSRALPQYLLVGAVTAAIVLTRLGATTLDDHEAKAALAGEGIIAPSRWLIQSPGQAPVPADTPAHRWLIPTNNGRPRLVKTPLPYWCIALVGLARGKVDEWTARLPSAVSAILCAWVTLALGRRMLSARAALMGALFLATTIGFQKWARNARPEMMLCLFITAAMACFYFGLVATSRPRRAAWMMGFWLAMALANLTKQFMPLLLALPLTAFVFWRSHDRAEESGAVPAGSARRSLAIYLIATAAAVAAGLAAPAAGAGELWPELGASATTGNIALMAALIAAPLLWYAFRARPCLAVARLLPTAVPGTVIMFAAFLPWMWYMTRLFGSAGEIFNEQVAERAAGTGGWSEQSPTYYMLPLITLTLPWLGFLPGAFGCAWVKRLAARRHALVYLFLWSVLLIALLTLSAGKRPHYILPMLPALSLLMGLAAEDVFFGHRWLSARLGRLVGFGYAAVLLAAPAAMAVMWGISAAGAEAIAAKIDKARQPSLLLLALRDPQRWLQLLIVTLLAALAGLAALRATMRGRLAGVMPSLLAAAAMIYSGFHAGGPLWDDRAAVADFGRRAAEIVPHDEPVASVGDPQSKTVYYFGRDIPSVYFLAGEPPERWETAPAHLAEFLRRPAPARLLRDPKRVAWMFCYGPSVRWLVPLGYQVVLQVQGEQERKLLFALLRNSAAPAAAPTGEPRGDSRRPAAGPTSGR